MITSATKIIAFHDFAGFGPFISPLLAASALISSAHPINNHKKGATELTTAHASKQHGAFSVINRYMGALPHKPIQELPYTQSCHHGTHIVTFL